MSFYKQWVSFFCGSAIVLGWYVIFEWRAVSVPGYEKGPCFSPNHAFYIKRYQTLWESMGVRFGADLGTARLYDRSNKLLYEGETYVKGGFGPEWVNGSKDDPANPLKVFYQGIENPGWSFILPYSPGVGSPNGDCYPTKTE